MKTIIITGANGNLGSVVTQTFLDKRFKVIATIATEKNMTDILPHENLEVHSVDLTDEETTNVFIQNTIEKYGKIDAALLLVGGFTTGNIEATGITDIHKQLSLNFDTAYHATRPLYKHMLQHNNGRIVFIGARPAINPAQGKDLIAYALSKSLLFKLAEFINEDAKGKNVTATVIVPSTLDTPLSRKSMPDVNPDIWVKPEALADILTFVVDDAATVLRETVLKVYNNS